MRAQQFKFKFMSAVTCAALVMSALGAIPGSILTSTAQAALPPAGTTDTVYNKTQDTSYTSIAQAVYDAHDDDMLLVYPGNYVVDAWVFAAANPLASVRKPADYGAPDTGWYLPIMQKGLQIIGVNDNGQKITDPAATQATVYYDKTTGPGNQGTSGSKKDFNNAVMVHQPLISVWAPGVTIQGLQVKANPGMPCQTIAIFESDCTVQYCNFPESADAPGYGGMLNVVGEGATMTSSYELTGITISDNYFDQGGIVLAGLSTGSDVTITGNQFVGAPTLPSYYAGNALAPKQSVGYGSLNSNTVTTLDDASVTIQHNSFTQGAGLDFSRVSDGAVDGSYNYWGGDDPTQPAQSADLLKGYDSDSAATKITIRQYYADPEMETEALPGYGALTVTRKGLELTATFDTPAVRVAGIVYQWYLDGVAIDGATGASYTAPSKAGTRSFSCAAGYSANESVMSNSVTITMYAITFDGNGGVPALQVKVVLEGDLIGDPAKIPAREGYMFAGFNTKKDGTGKPGDSAGAATEDLTFYAQWERDGSDSGSKEETTTPDVSGGGAGNAGNSDDAHLPKTGDSLRTGAIIAAVAMVSGAVCATVVARKRTRGGRSA
ncbi:MAG: InlB B-repeat-containing protein [Coriobacteriia bacterium]|nr:InlB B-repeat-containing protein [Coriobacteriia bacterium]